MTVEPWALIHHERRALAEQLEGRTAAEWGTQSLCGDWNVHQVLGHLTATEKQTSGKFVRELLGARFSVDRVNARGVDAETAGTPEQTLAEFRAHAGDETSPPGPMEALVGEIIVHGEDIRRPLGLVHDYPADVLARIAGFYVHSGSVVPARQRVRGLRLVATDQDWSYGDGSMVTGPMISLILAMTGRDAATIDLDGPGVETLRHRES